MAFELLGINDDEESHWDEYPIEADEEWNYPEPCDMCGGRQKDIGGQHWYNGSYQCYTLYLECENCGEYDVECV